MPFVDKGQYNFGSKEAYSLIGGLTTLRRKGQETIRKKKQKRINAVPRNCK